MFIAKSAALKIIRLYQRLHWGNHCRFQPTCSEYSYQAIAKYGILKGGFLSLKRILRCNPVNKGGLDELS